MISEVIKDKTMAGLIIAHNLDKTAAKGAILPGVLKFLKRFGRTEGSYSSPAGPLAMFGAIRGFSRAHERGENPFMGAAVGAGLGYAGGSLAVKTPYLRELFKQTPITGKKLTALEKSPAFRQQKARSLAEHTRRAARKDDKSLRLRMSQAKEYFGELGQDIQNPIASLRRQFHKFTKDIDHTTGAVTRKSPFDQAYMGYIYGGVPLLAASSALTTKEAPTTHRIGGALGNLASMVTPKFVPSLSAYAAADAVFPTQKYRMAATDLSQSVPTPQLPGRGGGGSDPYSFYFPPSASGFYY